MSAGRTWYEQGDWQVARVDGKYVVMARGGNWSSSPSRTDLPLWIMATCASDLDAHRIVRGLKAGTK